MSRKSTRRVFIRDAARGAVAGLLASTVFPAKPAAQTDRFSRVPLPFTTGALEPFISERTVSFHYDKHHMAYVDDLNSRVKHLEPNLNTLEAVIKAKKDSILMDETIERMAVLVWNHNLYWQSLMPAGGTLPQKGAFLQAFDAAFGTKDAFIKKMAEAASMPETGWVWLVSAGGKLSVTRTGYNETALHGAGKPLIVIDVWEHAYYLDYQNRRDDYLDAVCRKCLNWSTAEKNFSA